MQLQHHQFKRITIDPDMCFGKPCIRGMRMPVSSILAYLGGEMTFEQLLKEFPFLEKEDIFEALAFSATLLEDNFIQLDKAA